MQHERANIEDLKQDDQARQVMKVRDGFVSNSSSSSFIVWFPKVPTSWQEVKEILFKDRNFLYYSCAHCALNTEHAAQMIFEDIQGQMEKGLPTEMDAAQYPAENYGDVMDLTEILKISKENPDHQIFLFHYGDNDGDRMYVELEFGGTFDDVPHIRVNNH